MAEVVFPEPGETLRGLVRRVLSDLSPEVRAGVQVVTGGERAGLVVPQHAAPVPELPPASAESDDGSAKSSRRHAARRRTTSKETD